MDELNTGRFLSLMDLQAALPEVEVELAIVHKTRPLKRVRFDEDGDPRAAKHPRRPDSPMRMRQELYPRQMRKGIVGIEVAAVAAAYKVPETRVHDVLTTLTAENLKKTPGSRAVPHGTCAYSLVSYTLAQTLYENLKSE